MYISICHACIGDVRTCVVSVVHEYVSQFEQLKQLRLASSYYYY